MKLSQFRYKLPAERIAQEPAPFRDECRLMVLHCKSGVIEHRDHFYDILDYFSEHDVFVFNDTKVFPARLEGNKEKTGAKIEVFLLRELNQEHRLWDVLVEPARKIRIGNKLYFGENETLVAEVIDNTTSRGRTLRFLYDGPHEEFKETLYSLGEAPLPRQVISRPATPQDLEDFQTIYARHEGAVTAPASGLHFSRTLLKRMELIGIDMAYVTLHCGLGNFRSIDVEDLSKHKMEGEEMHVDAEACRMVNDAKAAGHHVCAVGTTVQRVLETAMGANNNLKEFDGWTNKFIYPPYRFGIADTMICNFYLPLSTMLMLACAFGDYDMVMKAYKEAVYDQRYRFGVYGDAMLIIND